MSINIGTEYYKSIMDTLSSTKTGDSLSDSLGRVSEEMPDAELMEACRSFESYFVEQMFKGMEKTVMKDEEKQENDYLTYFKDTLYQSYAESAVKREDFGIAKLLYESMKRV